MIWLLMWINKSVTTIDAMLQLLDIYRLQEILIVTRLTLKEYSVNIVSYFLQVVTNGTIGPQQLTRPNPATLWGGSSFFFTNCLQGCKKNIILMRKVNILINGQKAKIQKYASPERKERWMRRERN